MIKSYQLVCNFNLTQKLDMYTGISTTNTQKAPARLLLSYQEWIMKSTKTGC